MTLEPPPDSRTLRDELADSTAHGLLYLGRLRQRQLTLSILALVAFGALVGVLPLAIDLLPQLRRIHLLGVPLAIWLVVVPASPIFLGLAILYTRRADTLDEDFRELVRRR
ncbi:MAG TPA: sodium/substrate symporter small subunit [Solirubrobacteraceae bacterium]|nr:sodium/substrate symporter small subunit [Solirubrobacteraceae bacterium]